MEVFTNTTKVVNDDLEKKIKKGSKVSIASACFSIYAYEALKNNWRNVVNSGLFLPRQLL
ncbi:hypothetical protein [Absicoccus intestinalis]|uniref:Uncharacterized protein n=1 Tax=Absicoccus intestinalis TaxID=2926319 RepID=A0ABU4WP08_9FIRM|nr:hypothetical protein [Absicoccus sp. CLA-KB-P134]MDX8418290.1 hypothetical protein [Absicoccus sp. CLA-KB-P134]